MCCYQTLTGNHIISPSLTLKGQSQRRSHFKILHIVMVFN